MPQRILAIGVFILLSVHGRAIDPVDSGDSLVECQIVTLAPDGAWTWYNDERVIFWNNLLVTGYVDSKGKTMMGIYPLSGERLPGQLKQFELSSWTEKDDHNNPAFLSLGGESLLSVYAMHGLSKAFYSRIFDRDLNMGDEHSEPHTRGVTYSNLYKLEKEGGRIYNFFRGEGWNPNLVSSDDNAASWSDPLMIFLSGGNSTRPYVKYASNNSDRIDLFYTDGHPRNEPQNNIYHVYYRDGKFYRSNGEKIRDLEEIEDQPLVPGEGTMIYDGSAASGRGWVHDLERGMNGELAGVFISSPDGDEGLDLRYHYARFDPVTKRWNHHEVGYAGPRLYEPENHYAGGICIDPENIDIIYLSSTLDPATGREKGARKYQIYKGMTNDKGKTWTFEQLTHDLEQDNLRPFVPRNRPREIKECILWLRGNYRTYTDYDCEIVGIISGKKN